MQYRSRDWADTALAALPSLHTVLLSLPSIFLSLNLWGGQVLGRELGETSLEKEAVLRQRQGQGCQDRQCWWRTGQQVICCCRSFAMGPLQSLLRDSGAFPMLMEMHSRTKAELCPFFLPSCCISWPSPAHWPTWRSQISVKSDFPS